MKKTSTTIMTVIQVFIGAMVHQVIEAKEPAQFYDEGIIFPKESLLLRFPAGGEKNWREIHRSFTEDEGIVMRIPSHQKADDWDQILTFKSYDTPDFVKGVTLDLVIDILRKKSPPSEEEKVIWKVLEKDKNSVIYESQIRAPFKDFIPQHQIERGVLTEKGFYCVGFTRKGTMTEKEKNRWIKRLKEDTSVISFQEGERIEGLSLADKMQSSLSLGDSFKDWKHIHTYHTGNGFSMSCHIPPGAFENFILECLEIMSMPNPHDIPIEEFFKNQQKDVSSVAKQTVEFQVLERGPHEIIYGFRHKKNGFHLHAVVRSFLTDKGWYCMHYKQGYVKPLEDKELAQWQEKTKAKLKEIQVREI